MKEKDLVTKFRKFYGSLRLSEQKDLWYIMTALRGADDSNDDEDFKVKLVTTARIRGELFGDNARGLGYIFISVKKLRAYFETNMNKYSPTQYKERFFKSNPHFQDHVITAIDALNKHRPKKAVRDLQKFIAG